MGQAIVTGLLDTQSVKHEEVACIVASETSAADIKTRYGAAVNVFASDVLQDSIVQVCRQSEVVLLCTKPQIARQMLSEATAELKNALSGKLLISICGGIRIAQFKQWLPQTVVIRAMPNTPCKIRQGMTVMSTVAQSAATAQHKQTTQSLFAPLGRTKWLDEKHMDAVTSLSGSGPAFACVMLESLADGGTMMGLPRETSLELAACAMKGAAEMYLQTKRHPSSIKDEVVTPGILRLLYS